MNSIFCIAGVIGVLILFAMIAVSNAMAKMPASKNETMFSNSDRTYGIKYKNDCNDDDSWVG